MSQSVTPQAERAWTTTARPLLGGEARPRPLPTAVRWLLALSMASVLVTLPHSIEDFHYGIAARFHLGLLPAAFGLALGYAAQMVGLALASHRRRSGYLISLVVGVIWFLGAVGDHLERHSSNQHWRETPVILSRSATSAGILHASLTLTMARMTGLLDGVKSDTDRTFDYLNGALGAVLTTWPYRAGLISKTLEVLIMLLAAALVIAAARALWGDRGASGAM